MMYASRVPSRGLALHSVLFRSVQPTPPTVYAVDSLISKLISGADKVSNCPYPPYLHLLFYKNKDFRLLISELNVASLCLIDKGWCYGLVCAYPALFFYSCTHHIYVETLAYFI